MDGVGWGQCSPERPTQDRICWDAGGVGIGRHRKENIAASKGGFTRNDVIVRLNDVSVRLNPRKSLSVCGWPPGRKGQVQQTPSRLAFRAALR